MENVVGSFLEHHESFLRTRESPEQFIELPLAGGLFPCLGVLNGEDHDQSHSRHANFTPGHPSGRKAQDPSHHQQTRQQPDHHDGGARPGARAKREHRR